MRVPKNQTSPHPGATPETSTAFAAPPPTAAIHGRFGDRAADDDVTKLPVLCRYRDHWPQLQRMIDELGFPPGLLLSSNIRTWQVSEIRRWLAARPTARKIAPRRKQDAQKLLEKLEMQNAAPT